MKELSIVYQNADYFIRYECKKQSIRTLKVEYAYYTVLFDDVGLKEQFGEPFEFHTQSKPDFCIYLPDKSHAWNMADAIIKAITFS